jgi:transposase-like protein
MTAKRRRLPTETKARIALAAIRGEKAVSELAADYQVHPVQISTWKKQLLEGASGRERGQQQPPVEELYQQIGRLQFELEWLKKKSGGRD